MTIEEMANSIYFMQQHSGSLTEEEYEDVKHGIEVRRKAYIEGANAVLKEIEFAMSLSSGSEHVALEAIKQGIKNLKGGEK